MLGFFEGRQLVITSIWAARIPINLSPTIDFSLLMKTPFGDRMTIRTSSASTKNSSFKIKFHFLLASKFATDRSNTSKEKKNYLWVSNQKALDLIKSGLIPPAKVDPKHNPEYKGIDMFESMAQKGLWIINRVVDK